MILYQRSIGRTAWQLGLVALGIDNVAISAIALKDAANVTNVMADQARDPKITTLEVKRLSYSAIREIGTFSLMTKGPSPKEVSGKYLVVWERVRGDWKLAADIWNDGK